jgi:release factor glutamine methyltransferase
MLVREAIAQGSADLKYADIETPNLDASLLLAHILKTNRTELTVSANKNISGKICKKFCELIERRAAGECVAYLTGKKEFWGLDFTVNKSVLVPRPDTETLVEAALEIINSELLQKDKNILDLCTGSGAIAISIKYEKPELNVHAADISSDALETAKYNSKKLLPSNNQIHFYLGDLWNALPSARFSLIVSNPPYISSDKIQTLSPDVQNEPRLALDGGALGLEIINKIIKEAPDYLERDGYLLLEADPHQMDDIKILLAKSGFKDIKLKKDLAGANRVIGGKFEK